MAGHDREAEGELLFGRGRVLALQGVAHGGLLGGGEHRVGGQGGGGQGGPLGAGLGRSACLLGHGLGAMPRRTWLVGHVLRALRRSAWLFGHAREREAGQRQAVGAQARLGGQLGGLAEGGDRVAGLAVAEADAAELEVAPHEVGGAAQQLAQLLGRAAQLAGAAQRLGQAEAGQRGVGVEVEVAPQHPALGRGAELAVVAEQVGLVLAVLVEQDRELAEEGQDHAVDRGGARQALAVLLDEDDVGALGVRVGGEDEEVAPALADDAVTRVQPAVGGGGLGGPGVLGQRVDPRLAAAEVDAVVGGPQQGDVGREAGGGEGPRVGRSSGVVKALGGVAQAVLDAVEVVQDAPALLAHGGAS
ncbi:hypothetical protein OV079_16865 [Nannocystis pusilla]|uniref:Uncharacterized protein n=1 Tax=Nannocystis pusilla TaxID=889268 RepID=A0A9X3IWC4_9BACT|nr:hypothetical protein [Nannocystis pusilla]MCY1007197.1 hypothetical protein [Nannocystis pusilla]